MAESSLYSLMQRVLEICTFITSIGDFKTHKKECSTLIRRVKLLIPLFEEVRDLKLTISEEDLACFNALEAALNNAKILLLLCNTGSKLYLVLEQQEVAKQFLLLAAAFRQALNKPLSLDISDEVREQFSRLILCAINFKDRRAWKIPLTHI